MPARHTNRPLPWYLFIAAYEQNRQPDKVILAEQSAGGQ
jgi:hypothetical protein